MYAIRNKKTRKWLYGTDYRYQPPHQRTAEDQAIVFESYEEARNQSRWRRCGKSYEIVPVRLEALEGEA